MAAQTYIKVENLGAQSLYLGDIGRRTANFGTSVPRQGQEQYIKAGATIYLVPTGEVKYSMNYGTLAKFGTTLTLVEAKAAAVAEAELANGAATLTVGEIAVIEAAAAVSFAALPLRITENSVIPVGQTLTAFTQTKW